MAKIEVDAARGYNIVPNTVNRDRGKSCNRRDVLAPVVIISTILVVSIILVQHDRISETQGDLKELKGAVRILISNSSERKTNTDGKGDVEGAPRFNNNEQAGNAQDEQKPHLDTHPTRMDSVRPQPSPYANFTLQMKNSLCLVEKPEFNITVNGSCYYFIPVDVHQKVIKLNYLNNLRCTYLLQTRAACRITYSLLSNLESSYDYITLIEGKTIKTIEKNMTSSGTTSMDHLNVFFFTDNSNILGPINITARAKLPS